MNYSKKIPKLVKLEKTNSTNQYAVELLNTKQAPNGTVIWAMEQISGKGVGNNIWESEAGKNLTVSIIYRPLSLLPENQFFMLQLVALGVYDFLKMFIDDVFIKWPNDIYAGNKKLSGILIENSITGNKLCYSVAGIGININQTEFSPLAENPTSLKIINKISYKLDECLDLLYAHLDRNYQLLAENNFEEISRKYLSALYKLGVMNVFHSSKEKFEGRITGIDERGKLLVRLKSGEIRSFQYKEISYK